jgi:hypothetical protein
MHDLAFHPDSRHAADLFFCPTCHMLYIERNNNDYFTAHPAPPHCTITNDIGQPILWDEAFASKIYDDYGVDVYVYNHVDLNSLLQDIEDFRTAKVAISSTPEELIGQIALADDIMSAFLQYTKLLSVYNKGTA